MKHLRTFESYGSNNGMSREEMISHLCRCGWSREECNDMEDYELEMACDNMPMTSESASNMSRDEMIDHLCRNCGCDYEECDSMDDRELEMMCRNTPAEMVSEARGKKWIQKAIKRPGALKKQLGKEDLTKSDIKKEISKLKKKDKDKDKEGIQGLSASDLRKYKRLNLANTLMDLPRRKK